MRAAKAWQKIPSVWDALSTDDRAEMMALEDVEAMMADYERRQQDA